MEHTTAEATTPSGDLYRTILIPWQRKLLTKLIQIFGVLGLFALIPGVYAALQAGIPGIVVLNGVAYAALLPAYLLRERWYEISASVVVALQMVVGVGLLLTVGVEAASMLWLLAPMLIGNLLLRLRGTVVVFAISLIAMVAVAVLLQREALPWSIPLYAWHAIIGTYIALAVILTLATRFLMNHLLQGILYEQELNHELDHRVRNNLQLINSLIFLQSRQDNPSGAEEVLSQLNTRVMAMGAAFSAVNRTDRSFRVPLSEMLELLFAEGDSVGSDSGAVEVAPQQPTVSISVDTAVPVAIVLAEMVRAGSAC
ncbi:MAG: histidine kinase dimerization/phosphoacceptor domain -containing protein, partial [Alkalispirochaeta sp.]